MFKKAKQALLAALGSKKFVQARRVLLAGTPYVDEQGDRICHMCVQGVMLTLFDAYYAGEDGTIHSREHGYTYKIVPAGHARDYLMDTYGVTLAELSKMETINDELDVDGGFKNVIDFIKAMPETEEPVAT